MYTYIKGTLISCGQECVVIETHGIGYRIFLAPNHALRLPSAESALLLHLSFVIREFSQTLYGFLHEYERDLFEKLLNISGIGPKLALSIVGHLEPADLRDALLTKDVARLCKVPGIGKKTAERLLLELKETAISFVPPSAKAPPLLQDAISALINLGYSQMAAHKAVSQTLEAFQDPPELAHLITASLRKV